MERPFPAYKGDAPYIFVSYAHEDDALVYPEIQWLHDQGFNIWYDAGISPGSEWHQELADRIQDSSLFVYFITPQSVSSAHCQREVHYAVAHDKQLLTVHLEPTVLPGGLDLSLGSMQAIMRHELTHQEYRFTLFKGTSDHIPRGIAQVANGSPTGVGKTGKLSRPAVWIGWLGVGVVVLGLTLFLLRDGFFSMEKAMPSSPSAAERVTAIEVDAPQTAIRSNWMAVLPFRAVSAANEDESELLAEGITGDLISALSRLRLFSVTSHGAVRAYSDSSRTPRQITTELGVRYLIEGRVQVSGEQTRVGVTLVDGAEGKTIWEESKSYQGRDLLETQDDFTRFVSRALDFELLRFEGERVRNLPTEDMQAWEHLVLTLNGWADPTQATFAAAIREHRRALELEPNYVNSLGQLAVFIKANILMGESPDRAAAKLQACQLADRAITLGQDSPLALFSGVIVLADICGEAGKAVQISRRMVLAHPNSGFGQTLLGAALLLAGELEEALQVLESAERDFPDNDYVFGYTPLWKSMIYTEQQEWDKAFKVSRTALNLNPSDVFAMYILSNTLGVLDRPDEARSAWNQLLTRFPKFTIENFEWYLKQGLITDERVEPFIRGLKRAGVEEQ